MEVNKRFYWIDIIKIIACFCVVVNHASSLILNWPSRINAPFYAIQFATCKIGVPLFIMTTGYLLLNKLEDYKKIGKRITRILVPLILLSLYSYTKQFGFNLINFLQAFLKGNIIIPFWYLYMLIGLYIVTPFIKKMVDNFNLKDYKIFTVLFLIVPSILFILPIFNISISSIFTLAFFSIAVGYYVSGLFLTKIDLNKKNLIIAIFSFFIPIIVFIASIYLPYLKGGSLSLKLDSWMYITSSLPSLGLFYIIRYFFENKKIKDNIAKLIANISNTTFGIYLFHYFIIFKLYNLEICQQIFNFNGIIGVLSLELFVFIICSIASFILKKIPIVRNYL